MTDDELEALIVEGFPPSCEVCLHLKGGFTCDAFREGIPLTILSGEVPHDRPVPGDNGIQYEADPERIKKRVGL